MRLPKEVISAVHGARTRHSLVRAVNQLVRVLKCAFCHGSSEGLFDLTHKHKTAPIVKTEGYPALAQEALSGTQ